MVTVSVLEGGWIVFDQIRLEGADELVLERIMNMLSCAMWLRQNMKWKWMEQKYSLYWLM